MKLTGFLMVVAVVAVVLSAVNLFSNLALFSTGNAASTPGNVTLEIQQLIDINFTVNAINWSTGYVDNLAPQPWAYLNSEGVMQNNISFRNVTQGLILRSDATLNISVNLSSNKYAVDFLDGGVPATPTASRFLIKVSNNEPGSCGVGLAPVAYTDFNAGINNTWICQKLKFGPTEDELRIDAAVNISVNAPPGAKNITLTAIAAPN